MLLAQAPEMARRPDLPDPRRASRVAYFVPADTGCAVAHNGVVRQQRFVCPHIAVGHAEHQAVAETIDLYARARLQLTLRIFCLDPDLDGRAVRIQRRTDDSDFPLDRIINSAHHVHMVGRSYRPNRRPRRDKNTQA